MKPLHLAAAETLHVALDGPALRVSKSNASDHRFPLGRVLRIGVIGRVSWSTDALLACADEGTVVCFLKADGSPRGRWLGRPSKRSDFVQRWQNFLDRSDFRRRCAVRFCALRMGWPLVGRTRDLIQEIQAEADCGIAELRTFKRKLHGLAHARCLEELARTGRGSDDAFLTLIVPDLVTAIQWGLHPDFAVWRQGRHRHTFGAPMLAIAFYERRRNTCEFHLRETLRHLSRYPEGLE